jgi:hypothetical protein
VLAPPGCGGGATSGRHDRRPRPVRHRDGSQPAR